MLPVVATGSSGKIVMVAIGEAARRSGVGIETIRYYEREGIIPLPDRMQNGRRSFTEEQIENLRFIKRCRELGFALKDAQALLSISHGQKVDCVDVQKLGLAQLTTVRSKILELSKLELALAELTSNCAEGNTHCPMLDKMRSSEHTIGG